MKAVNLFSQSTIELSPRIHIHGFAGEQLMVTHVTLEAGAVSIPHAHPHEQMAIVLRGEVEFTIGDEQGVFKAGDVISIPGNVLHGASARSETELIELFTPVREDLVEKLSLKRE